MMKPTQLCDEPFRNAKTKLPFFKGIFFTKESIKALTISLGVLLKSIYKIACLIYFLIPN